MFVDTYITFLVLKVSLNSTVNKEHVLVYRQVSEYILFYSKISIFCLKIGLITLISLLQTGSVNAPFYAFFKNIFWLKGAVGPLKNPQPGRCPGPGKNFSYYFVFLWWKHWTQQNFFFDAQSKRLFSYVQNWSWASFCRVWFCKLNEAAVSWDFTFHSVQL